MRSQRLKGAILVVVMFVMTARRFALGVNRRFVMTAWKTVFVRLALRAREMM